MRRRWAAAIGTALQMLLLITSATQTAKSQTTSLFDVTRFGARGDGVTLDSPDIQQAIDASAKAGGGTVYFPAGTYLSGTILLKSNVTLSLAPGATLLGTKDISQYQSVAPGGSGKNWYNALVVAKGVHNVAIEGHGTIDGNRVSDPNGEERIRGPHAVLFYDCEGITVRDITIKDSGNYSLIFRRSEGINVDGVTVHGGWDGINMHDIKNATISNCRLFTGDDSLAGAYWENATVTNCILNSSTNGIRMGGRNVLFANSVIYGPGESPNGTTLRTRTEAGFQILPNGSGSSNKYAKPGPIDNVVLSDITMIDTGSPIYVAYSGDAPYSNNNLGVGRIVVNNLTALKAGKTPIYISAPKNNPAKSIVLNNVRVTFAGGANVMQSQEQGFSPYSILQSYGLYVRNVDDVELHNVNLDYAEADLRPAIFGEGIGTLDLDDFRAKRAAEGSPSIQAAGMGSLLLEGKQAAVAQAHVVVDLGLSKDTLVAGDPFAVIETVENIATDGLVEVPLQIGTETVSRSVWLKAGEKATISFVNLKCDQPGNIEIRSGQASKQIQVLPKIDKKEISAPYRTFQNTTAEYHQLDRGFYINAGGDYSAMQYGDQYASIYQSQTLPARGTIIVKLDNPDLRTNWPGLAGIIVRKDISKPGASSGYVVLGSSPAAGSYLQWDGNGDGLLDGHLEVVGYTLWPQWLKLERQDKVFTGYSSIDGTHWTKIGTANVPGAEGTLDVGMFSFRSSARFQDFTVTK